MQLTVVVADGRSLVRMGLRGLLEEEGSIAVVGEASRGEDALRLVRDRDPDVVLLGTELGGLGGLDVLRRLRARADGLRSRVVVVGHGDDDEAVLEALSAGASGFVLSCSDPQEVLAAVRCVAQGRIFLCSGVTGLVVAELIRVSPPWRPQDDLVLHLTEREREVVSLVATGLTNREIACTLMLSEHTIRTHVGRAMVKLEVRDRGQLVASAYRTGLAFTRARRARGSSGGDDDPGRVHGWNRHR